VRLEQRGGGGGGGGDGGVTGEVRVKGPTLFSGYYGNESATAAAFDDQGWFLTGDTATREEASGRYRILGRTSVDIIKCGGHKVRMSSVACSPLHCLPDVARRARQRALSFLSTFSHT